MKETESIKLWLVSLAFFVVVLLLSRSIEQGTVTFGILDHQSAGTAARVDEIQAQWREGGVLTIAIIAMLADLAWIWLYALGAFVAGKGFAAKQDSVVRALGCGVCAAAVVFAICDYTETILQFIQLINERGDDTMAGVAATAQPIKIAAFMVAFLGIIAALAIDRISRKAA